MDKIDRLEAVIKERVPGFQIKFKNEDRFMKFLGCILFFVPAFMQFFTTTLGKTVYFPNRTRYENNKDLYFETLAHEYVHILDYVRNPVLFILRYLFPQILALPALILILLFPVTIPLIIHYNAYNWLYLLLTAMFLAPIPSTRTGIELRGYGMDIKIRNWDKWWSDESMTFFVSNFTSSSYYFMCPFRNYVKRKLEEYKTDECLNDINPAYKDVKKILENI